MEIISANGKTETTASLKLFNYAAQPDVYEQELKRFFDSHKFGYDANGQPLLETGAVVICKFIESTSVLSLGMGTPMKIPGSDILQRQLNMQIIVSCHIVYYERGNVDKKEV